MSVAKEVDKLGRVVIPKEWRRRWSRRVVLFRLSEDEVLVRHMKRRTKLTEFKDRIAVEVDNFEDPHELRKAAYGEIS